MVQLWYAVSSAPIKSSICAFLLRFTTSKRLLGRMIHLVILLASLTAFITTTGVLTQAQPYALYEIWSDHSPVPLQIRWFSYFIAGMSIVLDAIIAFLPFIITWGLKLPANIGVGLVAIMALGSLGFLSTSLGLALTIQYQGKQNIPGRARLGICMIFELGVAVFAGSIDALKPLFQMNHKQDAKSPGSKKVEQKKPEVKKKKKHRISQSWVMEITEIHCDIESQEIALTNGPMGNTTTISGGDHLRPSTSKSDPTTDWGIPQWNQATATSSR
jgi:hypothetical protein